MDEFQLRLFPRSGWWVAICGTLIGASVTVLFVRPGPALIKGLFGPVSIGIGLVILALLGRRAEREDVPRAALPGLAVASVLGGILTGWVAIGIGEVVAAWLIVRWGVRTERAIAMGVALLAVASVALALGQSAVLAPPRWDWAAFLIPGVVFGARLAPFLTQWVSARALKAVFALVAIGYGVLFVVQSF